MKVRRASNCICYLDFCSKVILELAIKCTIPYWKFTKSIFLQQYFKNLEPSKEFWCIVTFQILFQLCSFYLDVVKLNEKLSGSSFFRT